LDYIVILICCIAASIVALYMAAKIIEPKQRVHKLALFLSITFYSAYLFFRNINTTSYLAILLGIFLLGGIIKILFSVDLKRSHVVAIMLYILMILAEVIIGTIFMLLSIQFDFSNPNVTSIIIFNTVIIFFLYLFIQTKITLNLARNLYNNLSNFPILIITFLVFSLMIILYSAYQYILPLRLDKDAIIYFIIIFAILIIFISLIIEKVRKIVLQNDLNQLTKYAENYEAAINRKIKFHHETKNQLLTIKGLIKNDNELSEYVESILTDYKLETYEEFDNLFSSLPHSPIRSLLIYKLSEIKNKRIIYDLCISAKSGNLNINAHNQKIFCKISGTIIDNAVEEASNHKEEGFITIDFKNNSDKLEIIVANPIKAKLKVKKRKNRGFGLLLAYDLVKENKRISIQTEVVNGCYIQKLTYKKK